jgi:ABC-2 type transport system permease protein
MTSARDFALNLRDSLTGFSGRRVFALMLRYWYLLRSSWPRLLELIYWPLVQMITWGFLQSYIQQNANPVTFIAGTLIGAMLLWDVLFRSQLGYSVSFLEEMWSRNLGNLFMSPLRPLEFMAAMMLMSLVRLVIGLAPVSVLAILFFGFNVYSLGFAAIGFFVNLVLTGWAVGIAVSGLVLRNGLGAEGLAWTVMFVLLPLSCVYYPVSVLPGWLQPVAWALPPTSIFEGLRALLIEQVVRTDLLLQALAMNAVLILAAIALFLWLVEDSRKSGSLLQMGE